MDEFELIFTQGLKGLFEMVEAYTSGDDIDREIIDNLYVRD